jgi:FtsP/CotA-like multicopper oxidase with cupredoxin domain/plastocyanin
MKMITGKDPVAVTLKAPGGLPSTKTRTMYNPLRDADGNVKDALILRRYKPPTKPDQSDAWTVPDDRKVNPWDLNEPDPTDNGTMGTIPGPVIECNVGDSVVVHFRNLDRRNLTEARTVHIPGPFGGGFDIHIPAVPLPIEKRVHSLHPHGFVFKASSDGAYPLSPPDTTQPVTGILTDESFAWSKVPGFSGIFKKGDRVPPNGTFVYHWNTIGWPTTSGVWLYHDHSICDMENVDLGAIGIIVIHNPADTQQEVDIRAGDPADPSKLDPAFLPDGSPNGSPINVICFPFPDPFPVRPHDLDGLGLRHAEVPGHVHGGAHAPAPAAAAPAPAAPKAKEDSHKPVLERLIRRGDFLFELDEKFLAIRRFCLRRYDTPPAKALYLQLFHNLSGVSSMMINGRTYLGNTPTMIAGRETRMRFGVVGMGNSGSGIHTFHIHGHRWIIPGPQGNTPAAIQGSPQVQAVSQFEDTRIFGPANSFVFTIDGKSGSFMRAGGRDPDDSLGEWHMHCHVLDHMMMGMMGSLLIVQGGEIATTLPVGVPCGHDDMPPPPPNGAKIVVTDFAFNPTPLPVASGTQVTFDFQQGSHTVRSTSTNMADPITVTKDPGGDPTNFGQVVPAGQQRVVTVTGMSGGEINYECGIHGAAMAGKITIT